MRNISENECKEISAAIIETYGSVNHLYINLNDRNDCLEINGFNLTYDGFYVNGMFISPQGEWPESVKIHGTYNGFNITAWTLGFQTLYEIIKV